MEFVQNDFDDLVGSESVLIAVFRQDKYTRTLNRWVLFQILQEIKNFVREFVCDGSCEFFCEPENGFVQGFGNDW